jgi:hypothetical protein
MARTSTGKVIGIGLVSVLAIVTVAALLTPVVVERSIGPRWVADTIERSLHTDVTIDRLDLSWTGPQSVHRLRLRDADGRPVTEIDLALEAGLLALVTGSIDRYDVHVEGDVHVERAADGSLSFARLTPGGGGGTPGGLRLPDRPAEIRFDRLNLTLLDERRGRRLELRDLEGRFGSTPGRPWISRRRAAWRATSPPRRCG